MFWFYLVGVDRPPKEAMPVAIRAGRFGFWCSLLGVESDSCGENSRWKGPTSRHVRVHFGKSGYSLLAASTCCHRGRHRCDSHPCLSPTYRRSVFEGRFVLLRPSVRHAFVHNT